MLDGTLGLLPRTDTRARGAPARGPPPADMLPRRFPYTDIRRSADRFRGWLYGPTTACTHLPRSSPAPLPRTPSTCQHGLATLLLVLSGSRHAGLETTRAPAATALPPPEQPSRLDGDYLLYPAATYFPTLLGLAYLRLLPDRTRGPYSVPLTLAPVSSLHLPARQFHPHTTYLPPVPASLPEPAGVAPLLTGRTTFCQPRTNRT